MRRLDVVINCGMGEQDGLGKRIKYETSDNTVQYSLGREGCCVGLGYGPSSDIGSKLATIASPVLTLEWSSVLNDQNTFSCILQSELGTSIAEHSLRDDASTERSYQRQFDHDGPVAL